MTPSERATWCDGLSTHQGGQQPVVVLGAASIDTVFGILRVHDNATSFGAIRHFQKSVSRRPTAHATDVSTGSAAGGPRSRRDCRPIE